MTLRSGDGGETTDMTVLHERLPNRALRPGAPTAWASVIDRLERVPAA